MKALSWITFIGLCVKTGTILFNYLMSTFDLSSAANNLYLGLDLSGLKNSDPNHFSGIVLLFVLVNLLKVLMFYYVILIFKKIDFQNPFTKTVNSLIKRIGLVALVVGLLTLFTTKYSNWIITTVTDLPNVNQYIYGGIEFVFFAGILFIIYLIFKIGIEYQHELEETV